LFIRVPPDQTVLSSSSPSLDRTVAYAYVTHIKKKAWLSLSSPVHLQKSRYRFPKNPHATERISFTLVRTYFNSKYKQKELKNNTRFSLPDTTSYELKMEKALTGCIWGQALISESQGGQHLPFPSSEPSERAGC